MTRSRRALLRSVGVLAAGIASGCSFGGCDYGVSIWLWRATDDRLVEEFSDPISVGSLGPVGERIAANVTRTGNVTYEAGGTVLRNGNYRRDGTFYQLHTTRAGSRPATGFEADIEVDFGPSGTPSGPVVAFEDLPAVDRRALRGTFLNSVARRIDGQSDPTGRTSGPGPLLYPEEAVGDSVLVPESKYAAVTYRGGRLTVSLGSQVPDAELHTYRVEAEMVADSREAFVRQAGDEVLEQGVVLDDGSLTGDQRDLVEAAIDAERSYDECIKEGGSEALRELTSRVFGVEWPNPSWRVRETFVRYNGTWYEASFAVDGA